MTLDSLGESVFNAGGVIENDEQLTMFLPALREAPWIAVDTEADSLHAYPEKLCLLQISIPDRDVLVDPLASLDLAPLWKTLEGRELILHAADYDLRLLAKHHGFIPARLFDTMIAARLLGCQQFGLANLVQQFLEVKLEKGPQKSDWAQRPLTSRMEEYARNDTHFLRPLVEILERELIAKGRLDWCRESCSRLIVDSVGGEPVDPDRVWRIKGSAKLSGTELAVLRELCQWREKEAVRVNKPPYFILRHETVIQVAQAAATGDSVDDLLPRRFSTPRRAQVKRAIGRGLNVPAADFPQRLRNRQYFPNEREKARFKKLRDHRDRQAGELAIDPTLIASKEMMLQLARDDSNGSWDGLMEWQRNLLKE